MFPFPVLLASTLVVWVLSPPGSTASVDGAKASLKAALPNDTIADVRVVQELPDEAEQARASSVTMVWSPDGRSVVLRVRKEGEGKPLQRELSFDARDSAKERGRAAGFAIASMLSDGGDTELPSPTAPEPAQVPERPQEERARRPPDVPALSPRTRNFALDAALVGGVGFGGAAGGVGGGIGARLRLTGPLWLHGLVRLRRGELADVRATSTFTTFGGGVYIGGPVAFDGRLSLGARSEVLLEWQYISHFSGDEPESVSEGRIVPMFGVLGEAAFRVSDSIELWLSVGPGVATGKTRLYYKNVEVTSVPVARGTLDLGFRAYF